MNERETMIATASFAAGWDAALDEARSAVAALDYPHMGSSVVVEVKVALAAIDALKDKP